ncbi:hypothetical protein DesyoDRAFT_1973 [Desulfosporosinus youngiae DSM 17734]|uniref:Ferredoxin n=1 Tax=Desulfosporosinus youngiae DSM 17734 TaxID=768710 RepID=H5Y3G8_9FIRM|nr:hypothetical protein DesyoDRAFT_1973 [Desulfosporosinus youngiae DSM 17734]
MSVLQSHILTDNNKCQGCNKCIRACPVGANSAYLLDGEVKVRINNERCIECGRCIAVCDHAARSYIDDTEVLFRDIRQGRKITILAAPSVQKSTVDLMPSVLFLTFFLLQLKLTIFVLPFSLLLLKF